MATQWNALVKPSLYVLELVMCTVVTIGTLDKLLFTIDSDYGKTHCAFDDNMATCVFTISAGFTCFFGGFAVLWYRTTAAFGDSIFHHDDESAACALLSVIWFTVAAVISAHFALPDSAPTHNIRAPRDVVTAFSWLLWASYLVSAAVAYFVPNRDKMDIYESLYGLPRASQPAVLTTDTNSSDGRDARDNDLNIPAASRKPDEDEEERFRALSLRRFASSDGTEPDDSYSLGASTGTPVDDDQSPADVLERVESADPHINEHFVENINTIPDISTIRRRTNRSRHSAPPFTNPSSEFGNSLADP